MALRWLLVLLALIAGPAAAQTLPPFTGLVVDAADVLPPATKAELTTKLEVLQRDTHRQLVVATIPDLGGYGLEEYGNKLIRGWGVGLKDANNGVILFIAPNEAKGHRGPRVEVGYGLEPILTDALSSTVINEQMMPRLTAGDVPGAMTAGTDALIAQLRATPDEAKARTDAAAATFDRTHRRPSSGAGGGIPVGLIFWGVVLVFIVLPMFRGRRGGRRWSGGGGSSLPIVLWSLGNAMSSGRGGGWGGGGWSGGGGSDGSWGGGGGFTGGGGGSGGGGGASGSW